MKPSVVIEMSTEEIKERIGSETTMLTKLKMNHSVSPLENPLKIRYMRRTIARMLTELHKRELAGTENDKDNKVESVKTQGTKKPGKTKTKSSETSTASVAGETQTHSSSEVEQENK